MELGWRTLSIFTMINNLNRIYVDNYPNSLGLFYSSVTDFLGFIKRRGI